MKAKNHVKSLECLQALAAITTKGSSATLSKDGLDATVVVQYELEAGGTAEASASLQMINAAYIGLVRLWPMIKPIKDQVEANNRLLEQSKKKEEREAKSAKQAEERAQKLQKKEEERKAKLQKKEEERQAKLAKREQERLAKLEAKEQERKAREAKKEEERQAKIKADAEKLKAAADRLAANGGVAPTSKPKTAAEKAVAAIKGGARMGKDKKN